MAQAAAEAAAVDAGGAASIDQYGAVPNARKPRRSLLVLFDLNGVLVHRASRDAPFTVRPGTTALFSALVGRVDIAFCTSMCRENASRALEAIRATAAAEVDAQDHVLQALRCAPIFAGHLYHFRNDVGVPLLPLRVPTLEPWRLLRNLDEVWQAPAARGRSALDTVLIDDTPGKCPLSPHNVVLVETWSGDAAARGQASIRLLARLAEYLRDAAAGAPPDERHGPDTERTNDVRTWLLAHPFETSGASDSDRVCTTIAEWDDDE
jgi:hypothetical protein